MPTQRAKTMRDRRRGEIEVNQAVKSSRNLAFGARSKRRDPFVLLLELNCPPIILSPEVLKTAAACGSE